MSSKLSSILETIAANFVDLAKELEEQEARTTARLDELTTKTAYNEQTLRDAAKLILERLG